MEPEQQAPRTIWCGGINANQDVSIRLVPNGIDIDQQRVTNFRTQEPLAVLKVHSTRLKKHSKYFQACLSKRWTNPDARSPSMEFSLELIHGLQVASYAACFFRMYRPLHKNFKDIKSCLELLRIASQIEFLELMNSICRYLSTILWSEEDELRIRQFSSSPDFPQSQAKDLVARLRIGQHGHEDDRRKLLCDQIARSIRVALHQDGSGHIETVRSAQSLFQDLFSSIRQSDTETAIENDVVTVVSKEVKEMLQSFHEDFRKHASSHNVCGETMMSFKVQRVSGFKRKLKALCWALELLLEAQMAEEVVECWLHLELFFQIIIAAHAMDSQSQPASKQVALRFCKLVILIFQEVVAGHLLFGIPDRVLLIEDWQWIDCIYDDTENDILVRWGFRQALEGVFLTLPLELQMEFLQRNNNFSHSFISTSSLVTLMKRNWPAESDRDAALQDDDWEVEGGVSDSMETA